MKFLKTFLFLLVSFVSLNSSFAQAATSTKVYKLPKEGVRIKPTEANFSVFPTKLPFSPGKNIFLVSRKWQTACLYNVLGEKQEKFCVQTATGRKELPTELGLYNIQTKNGKDYKSTFYTSTGDKPKKEEEGAPMPYAMHIGRIIGQAPNKKFWFDFSDGTAVHEKQTVNKSGTMPFVSHGCIAVEKGMAQKLQTVMNYGDLVLVFNDNIPNSIQEMISIYE